MSEVVQARLVYTEPMLRIAVRTYMWRRLLSRPLFVAAFVLVLGCDAALLWIGSSSFVTGLLAASVIFPLAFVASVWRAHHANTIGRFRAMRPPEAEAVFGPADMTVSSSLGSTTIPWSAFQEKWELEVCWLLFMAPNQFVTLPSDALTPELRVFLRSHLPA